ncbi:MAG: thioredoxin family protein [Solirubrobacteraceae bacterium]
MSDQSSVQHLTVESFDGAVAEGLTIIDFWAAWCGPCRAMAPQFERAAQLRPAYRFAKVDVDAEPELAARYSIRSIPTLMVLRDGEPIVAQAGAIGADQLVDALDRIAGVPAAAVAAEPVAAQPVAAAAAQEAA